jgi:hypothetical protein
MRKCSRALSRICRRGILSCLLIGWQLNTVEAENTGVRLWPRLKIGNEVYIEVVYVEHDASRVKFKHASGIANIPISELPSTLQKELDYDPSKAAENEVKLASEQQAIREQVQADATAAHQSSFSSANSSRQPEEKDGMIRVMDTEIIPPEEVQRLGIAGLQKYRQPDESPLEQMDREKKTGVIRKVWKWVSKVPDQEERPKSPNMIAAEAEYKALGLQQKGLFNQRLGLIRQADALQRAKDWNQRNAVMKQINALDEQMRALSQMRTIQERLKSGTRDARGYALPDSQRYQ